MKFALKSLVAASAIAAVSLANAATVTVPVNQLTVLKDDARAGASGRSMDLTIISGGGGLYFSNGTADPTLTAPATLNTVGGLVGALNVGKVAVTSVDNAVITEETRAVGKAGKATRSVVNINAAVTSLTADTGTGAFSTVTTLGGATQTAPYIDFVLDGGRITVKDLVVDLGAKTVSATLTGNPLNIDGTTYGPQVNFTGVLWNVTEIVGPTALPPEMLIRAADGDITGLTGMGYNLVGTEVVNGKTKYTVSATNYLKKLTVTDDGFATFAAALGLVEGATGYDTLFNVNASATGWGTLKSEIVFTAVESIPEPSTYAMMGVGLVGVAFMARRRRAVTQ